MQQDLSANPQLRLCSNTDFLLPLDTINTNSDGKRGSAPKVDNYPKPLLQQAVVFVLSVSLLNQGMPPLMTIRWFREIV